MGCIRLAQLPARSPEGGIMSQLRDDAGPQKVLAHSILDQVRAGVPTTIERINWALSVLGEPVEA